MKKYNLNIEILNIVQIKSNNCVNFWENGEPIFRSNFPAKAILKNWDQGQSHPCRVEVRLVKN